MNTLRRLIIELEQDTSLDVPDRLRQRVEALDRLDAYFPGGLGIGVDDADLARGALAIQARLEAVNHGLYDALRQDIQQGNGPHSMQPWSRVSDRPDGEGYDYLDELLSGLLQLEPPDDAGVKVAAEMVFYQPTPARHIFDLIDRAAIDACDVLIDLGSGLGHVPILTSLCTGALSIGVELEAAYVDCARRSAEALHLSAATFVRQDARLTDLSQGTVFYLYTPFQGTIMRAVLDALRREAVRRAIRVCTFGPCTPTVAQEPWLVSAEPVKIDRIAVFRSRPSL
jgi:hypothetical protein